MSLKVLAFHGSPGVPEDFEILSDSLAPGISLEAAGRDRSVGGSDAQVLLGYSWGCYSALQEAVSRARSKNPVERVILVAPYLFPEKSAGILKSLVLKTPGLGDLILRKAGGKVISEFLEKSAYPAPVSAAYRALSHRYLDPSILRRAALEKDGLSGKIDSLLTEAKRLSIPFELIWGTDDQTSSEEAQFEPLRKRLRIVAEHRIAGGGHALIFTHAPDVAGAIAQRTGENKMTENRAGYYPGENVHNNVHEFLEMHLKKHPDLPVLKWANREALANLAQLKPGEPLKHDSITVREMYDKIGRVSAGLLKLGITKGDRVILFVPMSIQLYTAMFALQKIGAIPVFLDSWARRGHLGASAAIVSPKAMISFEKAFELCADVPELAGIPVKISVGPTTRPFAARLEELMAYPEQAGPIAVEQEHTALITFTTGSSGTPKGANRTHRFLAAQHYALNECIPYVASDVDLPVFPIFSLNNLAAGVSTVIPAFDIGVPGEHDPQILLAQILSTGTTCTTLSPSLFNRLATYCLEKGVTLPQLRRVVTGGAPVSRDNVVDFQKVAPKAEIWILFGSTEAEPMAHIEGREMVGLQTRASTDSEWVDEGVNVGHMAEGLLYRFLKIQKGSIEVKSAADWASLEVPKGEVGELIVAGEHVCRNYYNDTEAFKRAKIMDENGTVWHRTGDLGRLDENGYLWIVGRVHNAIQRDGKYQFPVRAEMVMKKLPFVKLAAYLGVPDPKLGEKTVCVAVAHEGASGSDEERKAELLRIMDKNGIPVDQVIFRENIPMDPRHHSKVEYDVLRKELQAQGLV